MTHEPSAELTLTPTPGNSHVRQSISTFGQPTPARERLLACFINRNDLLLQTQGLSACADATEKQRVWRDFDESQEWLRQLGTTAAIPAPSVSPLSPECAPYLDKVQGTDAFQESFGGRGFEFAEVSLEALQAAQYFINLDDLRDPPLLGDQQRLLEYCLPWDPTIPAEATITPTGVRYTSKRYGHSIGNVRRRVKVGQVVLAFEHPNLLVVYHVVGNINGRDVDRMIVLNGTHRSVDLLDSGHTKAPALVIRTQNPAEVPWPQGQGPGFFNADFMLFCPRPAMISDFLGPGAVECSWSRMPSIVDVTIGGVAPAVAQQVPMPMIQLRQGP